MLLLFRTVPYEQPDRGQKRKQGPVRPALPSSYRVYEQEKGTAVNKEDQKCVLSMKDLCTLDILPQILEAGVFSLKIEGRMKSPDIRPG